jgi:CheY-like chemotaxis protein
MPDLNGFEIVRDLRASAVSAATPIVLHSTKVLTEAEEKLCREYEVVVFGKQALTETDSATRLRELMDTLTSHHGTLHAAGN